MKLKNNKERKIIFLDIDGVLQPSSSQERFNHINMRFDKDPSIVPEFILHLQKKHEIDFTKYKDYDVAAVYYDWNKISVVLLRLLLKVTGAKIVLSSDWRLRGFQRMKDFFTIHGLETYYIDNTKNYDDIDKKFIEKLKQNHKDKHGKNAYLEHRSIEILEWLHRNPDVKKWVAIDDLNLNGIESNFVLTESYCFLENDAVKCFKILNKINKNLLLLSL